ncbi:prepilin peptidase CpaA [Vibrio xiamenensis]|uniref:Prepilin peptidase CpaA n=1 Tax=Vibrio xiamenensis TaxID=861298 RepID=A0A1G7W1Y1_9VIBR|nr:prepilin peptidase [Vibrio xiamenensis]SDG66064.1 prepilin peptidase CpaA [Vibrio xiamenensis]
MILVTLDYMFWSILFFIAVIDAREHRIPNQFLITLIITVLFEKFVSEHDFFYVIDLFLGCFLFFFFFLLLYFMNVMSPGDVKLMGVVGLWCGWNNAFVTVQFIFLSAVVVGFFYYFLNVAGRSQVKGFITPMSYLSTFHFSASGVLGNSTCGKLTMPFAPIVVIGLALHQYFNQV